MKKCLFIWLLCSLSGVVWSQEVLSPGSEMGDAVFRPMSVFHGESWFLIGHAALYRNSDASSDWNPVSEDMIDSDRRHSVIQATGEGTVVSWHPFDFFLSGHNQSGKGYTAGGGVSTAERKALVRHARDQYGATYPWPRSTQWYYPRIMTPNSAPGSGDGCFRCDGLVEYCYEQIGKGFFSVFEKFFCWFTYRFGIPIGIPIFYPAALRRRMDEENPTLPELNIISPQDGDVFSCSLSVNFTTKDGVCGSGIDRIRVFFDGEKWLEDDEDCDTVKMIDTTFITEDIDEGTHHILICSFDRAGNTKPVGIKVYKGEAPIVSSTDPWDWEVNVPLEKHIKIVFSKPMDQPTTEGAISIEPSVSFIKSWQDEKKIVLIPSDSLDYCTEYTVTVTDAAEDTSGIHLDGDGDGKPGGDYEFSFSTEIPNVPGKVEPTVAHVDQGELVEHIVYAYGSRLKKDVNCLLTFDFDNPVGWTVSGANSENFALQQNSIHEHPYSVTNCGATDVLDIHYEIGVECALVEGEGYVWTADGHTYDHPDDNEGVETTSYPTPWFRQTSPDSGLSEIGIMLAGWSDGIGHILGKYNIPTTPIKPNLKLINHPETELNNSIKLLVVGSAALSGFDSPTLRQRLSDFVSNGGVLLCLTQKHGSDFEMLPGNPSGYGWEEDQSCFTNAAYISEWHPVFSGQSSVILNCNMDGYITDYPSYSQVLLRRTSTGMPALLYYPYGSGYVIVSSLYSDWGYGHSHVSYSSELPLVRDLLTWALAPSRTIPEYHCGDGVTTTVYLNYSEPDTQLATSALLKVYTPSRVLIEARNLSLSPPMYSGEWRELEFSDFTAPGGFGIWPVGYILLSNSGDTVQTEKMGGRFAVKREIDVGGYEPGDLMVWATTPSEYVFPGTEVNYTIWVRNNTDDEFHGKIMVGIHEDNGAWWSIVGSLGDLTIPRDSLCSFNYTRPLYLSTSTYFGLYPSSCYSYSGFFRNAIASCQKGVWVIESQDISLNIATDMTHYLRQSGEEFVHLSGSVSNNIPLPYQVQVRTYLASSPDIFSRVDTFDFADDSSFSFYDSISVGSLDVGRYCLVCEAYRSGNPLKRAYTYFYVEYPHIFLETMPTSNLTIGNNSINVRLRADTLSIPPGRLNLEFYKSKGDTIWRDSISLNSVMSGDTTLNFNLYIDSVTTGWYYLYSQYHYGTHKITSVNSFLSFLPSIHLYFDRSVHRVGDTLEIYLRLRGYGSFSLPAYFTVTIPSSGDEFEDSCLLVPGEDTLFSYTTVIPDTLGPGYYPIHVSLTCADTTICKTFFYAVSKPSIFATIPDSLYTSGGEIPIIFGNSGGVTGELVFDRILLYDLAGEFQHSETPDPMTIGPGEAVEYDFGIPSVITGIYKIRIEGDVEPCGESFSKGFTIQIQGIEASLDLTTDKYFCMPDESIKTLSLIRNENYPLDGELCLRAVPSLLVPECDTLMPDEYSLFGCRRESSWVVIDTISALYPLYMSELIGDNKNVGGKFPKERVEEYLKEEGGRDATNEMPLATNSYGDVYLIANGNSGTLRRFDPHLNPVFERALPEGIGAIADMEAGNLIYLSDNDSGMVRMVDLNGNLLSSFGKSSGQFNDLWGIGMGEGSNIWLTERATNAVWEFSQFGDSLTCWVLDFTPQDVAVSNGYIYVCCGRKLLKVTPTGVLIDSFGMEIADSLGYSYDRLTIDEEGNIYTTGDWTPLLRFSSDGRFEAELYGHPKRNSFNTGSDSLLFILQDMPCKGFSYVSGCEVVGEDKGIAECEPLLMPPSSRITSIHPFEHLGSGSITYEYGDYGGWRPINELVGQSFEEQTLVATRAVLRRDDTQSPKFGGFEVWMLAHSDSSVWADTRNISIASYDSLVLSDTIAGVDPGDYLLKGVVSTTQHQTVDQDMVPFSILSSGNGLFLCKDKSVVLPGDTVHLTAEVVNLTDSSFDSVRLFLFRDTLMTSNVEIDSVFLDTAFALLPQDTIPYSFTITPHRSFFFRGELAVPGIDTIKATEEICVAPPLLLLDVESPNVVGHSPFTVTTTVENGGDVGVPFFVSRELTSVFIDTLFLSPNDAVCFVDTFVIARAETLRVDISSQWMRDSLSVPIGFGESIRFSIDSSMVLPEDSVSVNFMLENTGVFMVSPYVSLLIRDSLGAMVDSNSREYSIQVGAQLSDEMNYDGIAPGDYELQWLCGIPSTEVVFDGGISHLSVTASSDIVIDTILVADTSNTDSTFFVKTVVKSLSPETFVGNIELSTSFWEADTVLYLTGTEDTIVFALKANLQEALYSFQVTVSEGGYTVDSKLEHHFLSPLFRFSESPQVICASIEDTVSIPLEVTNVGITEGEVEVAFEFGDIADIHDTLRLESREIERDTIRFVIPEDLPGGEYWTWLYLGEERNLIKVRVEGYGVDATASLDCPSYGDGDTAHLVIDVDNLSNLDAELSSAVNYNDFHSDTNFVLSGFSSGVDFIDSGVVLSNTGGAYSDSGFYCLPTFDFDADSIRLSHDAAVPPQTSLSFYARSSEDRKHWGNWCELADSTGYGDLDGYVQLRTDLTTENADTTPLLRSVTVSVLSEGAWSDTLVNHFESPNALLHFEIPVWAEWGSNKAAYGIYSLSGRALYLNSIYIYLRNDTLNLTLDKQVYDPGDTVNVTVESAIYGDSVQLPLRVYFAEGEEIVDTLSIDSTFSQFSFDIPTHIIAGTYLLEYALCTGDTQLLEGERPFDVNGVWGIFVESDLDTNIYSPGDTARLNLLLRVNAAFLGRLKGWLKSLGKDMPLVFDTTFVLVDSLPNQIEIAFPISLGIRGPAQVVYTLFWEDIPICGGSETFDIFIGDSTAPLIQLVELPEDGYVSNRPYEVTAVIEDESPFYDTLYYCTDFSGWSYTQENYCQGDTFTFSIPPQSNGTEVEYYLTVTDTFGNSTREPVFGYHSFWIYKPLAPNSMVTAPAETTAVSIGWGHPIEEINYDMGTPSESRLLAPDEIAAVRFTPQYYPCGIHKGKFYIDIPGGKECTFEVRERERNRELQVCVFDVDPLGEPGDLLAGPHTVEVVGTPGWFTVSLESLNIIVEQGEFYLGVACADSRVLIYGDAHQSGVMRSRIQDGEGWRVDSTLGNILIRTEVIYAPGDAKSNSNLLGYRVLRRCEDDTSFVVIRDTVTDDSIVDTNLEGETRYLYKVSAVYNQPDRLVESEEVGIGVDWSPPVFENVGICESSDTSIGIEAEITDWSGILWDSLYYRDEAESLFTGMTHDGFDSVFHYTVPYVAGDSLFYWLSAVDSSMWHNLARWPDSGCAHHYMPSTGVQENIPKVFFLSQNAPNPFTQKTVISYQLPVISKVSLKVYDLTGRLVRTLVDEEKKAGYYKIKWSGKEKNLASGIYFVRMSTAEFTKTRKIVLIK